MLIARTSQGIGRLVDDQVELLDLPQATILDVIGIGAGELAKTAVTKTIRVADLELLAPVDAPPAFGLVGANYASHIAEAGMATPEQSATLLVPGERIALTGANADIVLPAQAPDQVDYEGEVAILVGSVADNVSPEQAWECIAGFMALNDVSARDVQFSASDADDPKARIATIMRAKGFPTFKPCGPGVLPRETLDRDVVFEISTTVNGATRQHASTAEMLFDPARILSEASRRAPVLPGTVITTGTPSGVGFVSGDYLRAGDVVEVEVSSIGVLRSRVVMGTSA